MDQAAQGNAIFTEGIFLDDREEGGVKVQLYRVHSFYVEVYYEPKTNRIVRFRSFKSTGQLAPYVKLK